MSWKSKCSIVLLFLTAVLASSLPATAADSPLEAFAALVVGEWEANDSRHVFEWGVGQKALRSRSYHKAGEGWTQVSEGLWFWDAKQETIRGVAVATGMPVDLFEYRADVRDQEVVHDLVAQGPAGGQYVERWVFEEGKYRWSLEVEEEGQAKQIMGGAYRRTGAEP